MWYKTKNKAIMKVIKFENCDGEKIFINPTYVSDFKVVRSDYTKEMCIAIFVNHGNESKLYTMTFKSDEECEKYVDYIVECIQHH